MSRQNVYIIMATDYGSLIRDIPKRYYIQFGSFFSGFSMPLLIFHKGYYVDPK